MIRFALALLLCCGSAWGQSVAVARQAPVYPVDQWPTCWPEKTTTGWAVATAETDYGFITAWWCPDGAWSGITRPKNPVVDPLAAAYLEAAVLPKLDVIKTVVVNWYVAPNGTYTTRPAYTLENGVLKASTTRATVGDLCDLGRAKYVSGAATYGAIPGSLVPPLVAVCKVKP